MSFIPDATTVAREAMRAIAPDLAERYARLIEFLATEPAMATALRGKKPPATGSKE